VFYPGKLFLAICKKGEEATQCVGCRKVSNQMDPSACLQILNLSGAKILVPFATVAKQNFNNIETRSPHGIPIDLVNLNY